MSSANFNKPEIKAFCDAFGVPHNADMTVRELHAQIGSEFRMAFDGGVESLRSLCSELGLSAEGSRTELRQRLNSETSARSRTAKAQAQTEDDCVSEVNSEDFGHFVDADDTSAPAADPTADDPTADDPTADADMAAGGVAGAKEGILSPPEGERPAKRAGKAPEAPPHAPHPTPSAPIPATPAQSSAAPASAAPAGEQGATSSPPAADPHRGFGPGVGMDASQQELNFLMSATPDSCGLAADDFGALCEDLMTRMPAQRQLLINAGFRYKAAVLKARRREKVRDTAHLAEMKTQVVSGEEILAREIQALDISTRKHDALVSHLCAEYGIPDSCRDKKGAIEQAIAEESCAPLPDPEDLVELTSKADALMLELGIEL